MSLYRYFKTQGRELPNPSGPLSSFVSSAAIEEANAAVSATCTKEKRGPYQKLSDETRAKIGKYASENGDSAAARHFSTVLSKPISRTTVHGLKKAYYQELSRKRKAEEDLAISTLPTKKRGRPLLLGEDLDTKVQQYLRALRESGGAINTAIVLGAARGIILKTKRTVLAEYGGHVVLTKDWAKGLMQRMGFVKRRGTTAKSRNLVERFDELKAQFLEEVATTVYVEDIPPELILNWDQTGINLVPSSSWTMEQKGAKRVELTGIDDKRQITAVFCGSLTGDFLPIQLVYQGKTNRCHPQYQFPTDWHITHSPNHWATEESTKDYLREIFFPYIDGMRSRIGLEDDHPALAIFDNFKGQITVDIMQLLEEHNVHVVKLPPNCTDRLQPMDLSVNKAAKNFLRGRFNEWYSEQVADQLGDDLDGLQAQPVNLTAVAMKSVGGKWLVEMHEYISSNPQIVVNGFHNAGIQNAIDAMMSDYGDSSRDPEIISDNNSNSDDSVAGILRD